MRACVVGLSVSFCTRFSVASLASLFFAVLFFSWSAEKKPVAEPSGLVVPTPCESKRCVRVRVEPVGCCRELRSK